MFRDLLNRLNPKRERLWVEPPGPYPRRNQFLAAYEKDDTCEVSHEGHYADFFKR